MRVSIRFFAKFGEIFGREHLVEVPEGSRIIDTIRMITNEKREIIDDMLISLVEMFEDHVLEMISSAITRSVRERFAGEQSGEISSGSSSFTQAVFTRFSI